MPARLHVFGPPTIAHGAGSVALPFERRSPLLVFLALKRAWVARAELAALLCPEQAAKLAFPNLRKTCFGCRRLPEWQQRGATNDGTGGIGSGLRIWREGKRFP